MSDIDDPEIRDFVALSRAFPPEDATIAAERRAYDAMCAALRAPRPGGVAVADERPGGVAARRYRPAGGADATLLYLHGGGFVVGGLESHDDICAELSVATGAEVVCPDYRLAPEHRHPAALDDVCAIWRALPADRPRIVAGDSAGGTLAAALCLRLAARGRPGPDAMALVYPGLGGAGDLPSRHLHAHAPLLGEADIGRYEALRRSSPASAEDPEFAPLAAPDLSVLPPAFVITADIDPLRDDGTELVRRLAAAGGSALLRNEAQLVHGFLRARHRSSRASASFRALTGWIARRIDEEAARGPVRGVT